MEQELAIYFTEIIGKTIDLGPLVLPALTTLSQEPTNELFAQALRDFWWILPTLPGLMVIIMAIFQTAKEVDQGPDDSETLS